MQKVALCTTDTPNKPRVKYRTEKAWFRRLLWHQARKRSRSILTTSEATWGYNDERRGRTT